MVNKDYLDIIDYPNDRIPKELNASDFIFCDVDNTVCDSCTNIEYDIAKLINQLTNFYNKKFIFISGTGTKELFGMISKLLNVDHYILSNSGKSAYKVIDGYYVNLYEDSMSGTDIAEVTLAIKKVMLEFDIDSKDDQIIDKGSQVTFSILGRYADKGLKYSYDVDNSKRKLLIKELRLLLPKYSFKIGGTTSIDIHKGNFDKCDGITNFVLHENSFRYGNKDICQGNSLFIGDKLNSGGNDYPAANILTCVQVKCPDEFKHILEDVQKYKLFGDL